MTEAHDVGDMRSFNVVFTDKLGVIADPTTVAFKIKQPDGTEINYLYGTDAELVKDSVGNYHVDFIFTQSCRHISRFEGTGDVSTAEQIEVYIRKGI